MTETQANQWHHRAKQVILGGVNSPSRSYKSVGGGAPPTMVRGEGPYLFDVDGTRYIDYAAAYGPVILGHAHPGVAKALSAAASEGILYGTPTTWEVEFGEMLQSAIPDLERLRFVNSGTEAVMTTIRLARAVTNRNRLIKFAGCYHGHSDAMLVAAGSGPSSMGTPDSAGVTKSTAEDVITVPFNDVAALQAALDKFGPEVAAVLVEPIVGNFGMVPPTSASYLQTIIDLAHNAGALVIFDEVITAFRFHYGSAAQLYNVHPDLYAMGKIIGGGTPIGAYGGKRSIMEAVAPLGPTYQAGTMAGNPLSMRAGMACLTALAAPGFYEHLDNLGHQLATGIAERARAADIPIAINRIKGAFTVYFGEQFRTQGDGGRVSSPLATLAGNGTPGRDGALAENGAPGREGEAALSGNTSVALAVRNYEDAKATDSEAFADFFHALARRGIWTAPSKYEAWFITAAHTEENVRDTLNAVEGAFQEMKQKSAVR